MIKVYRKTGTIKAEQFDGSNAMVKKYHISVYNENIDKYGGLGKSTPNEYIFNGIYIDIGDWVATGIKGEHWTISDDMFKKTYAELPVIPKTVADWIEKCKHDGTSVGDMLYYESQPEKVRDWIELTPGTYDFNQRRYAERQDLVARAWLDGYEIQ